MDSAAIHPSTRTSFWARLFGTAPKRRSFNRRNTATLSSQIGTYIDALEKELHSTDDAEMSVTDGTEMSETDLVGLKVGAEPGVVSVEGAATAGSASKRKRQVEETFKRSKVDFLHRHIIDFQRLFDALANLSDGDAYLFLDDLYHIRRVDQARVIDYFHRLAKDHHLWLKVGSIRHRTSTSMAILRWG